MMGSTPRTAGSYSFASDVAEKLGLVDEPPVMVRRFGTNRLAVARLVSAKSARHQIDRLARDDAFVVSLHLRAVRRRIVRIDGRQVDDTVLSAHSTCLYDLKSDISADLIGPFDVVQFYIPRAALNYLARENDLPRVQALNARQGAVIADPAIKSLGCSLVPALEDSQRAIPLFVDELVLALQFHLIRAYTGGATAKALGGLAPWQRRRATEMMASDLSKAIHIADVARECRLSVRHFIRAFRESMGMPPYKWLLDCRVNAAKEMMLKGNRPLAEIATDCGFTDQSHLTRVFTNYVGTSPAAWRRNNSTLDFKVTIGTG